MNDAPLLVTAATTFQPTNNNNNKIRGVSTLLYACQQGNVDKVRRILRAQPESVLERDRTGKSALHYCCTSDHISASQAADVLAMAAPDLVDSRDEDGFTPLHLAVIAGNMPLVTFLLANNADVNAVDNEKHTVVHWATVCGETVALRAVLAAGAPISTPDVHGGFPLHYAAQMCGGQEKDSTSLGLQVLHTLLSQQNVNVSTEDCDGRQPLLWAASAGSAKAVLALIRAGGTVEAHDKDGLTALHCAASRGHTDTIDTLLTLCGASPDVIDSNGCTALHYAVTLGHADATALLLTHAADPNKQDRKGRSPAHCGCAKGQLETVKMLGGRGANLWLRNAKGDLPLHEAAASGRRELVKWLLESRPSYVNARNNDGRCPLHLAALNDNADMCKILLDAGAQVNPILRTSKNIFMTPLDCALLRGFRSTAKYLQLHGGVPANRLANHPETTTISSGVSLHIRDDVTLWGGSSSDSDEAMKDKSKKKPNKRKLAYKSERRANNISDKFSIKSETAVESLNGQTTNQHGEIYIYANEVNISDRLGTIRVEHNREVVVGATELNEEEIKPLATEKQRPRSAKYGSSKRSHQFSDSSIRKIEVDENQYDHVSLETPQKQKSEVNIDQQSEISTTSHDDGESSRQLVVEASVHVPPKQKVDSVLEETSKRTTSTKDTTTITNDLPEEEKKLPTEIENTAKSELEYTQNKIDFKSETKAIVVIDQSEVDKSEPVSEPTIVELATESSTVTLPVEGVSVAGETPHELQQQVMKTHVDTHSNITTPDNVPTSLPETSTALFGAISSTIDIVSSATSAPEASLEQIPETSTITQTSVIISPPTPETLSSSDKASVSSTATTLNVESPIAVEDNDPVTQDDRRTPSEQQKVADVTQPLVGTQTNLDESRTKITKSKHTIQIDQNVESPKLESSIEAKSSSDERASRRSTPSSSPNEHRSFKVLDTTQNKTLRVSKQKTSSKKQRPLSEKHKDALNTEHERLKRSKIPTPIVLSKSDKHLDRCDKKASSEMEPRVPSLPNIHDDSAEMNFRHSRSVSNLSAPVHSVNYSDIEGDSGSDIRDEISTASKKKRLRKRSKARSAKSAGSDYESSNLIDSGFEPSPRSTRIPKWRNMSDRGVVMTSVTQTIQSNIRRYHLERKIFQHLLDLKRLQIRSGQHNEHVLVKRAIDTYHRSCAATVGAGRYTSQDLTFKSFENFLYRSLRKIQQNGAEHLHGLPETPRNPLFCTQSTHRCDHATHAYTGVPCAAYLPKMDHHSIPKIGFDCKPSGFLPKITPKNAVTLELCHGNDKQLISLPAERLDQNKRYYVTFTVKGNDESMPVESTDKQDHKSHIHSRSD